MLEQLNRTGLHGHLAASGPHQPAPHPDEVIEVEQLDRLPRRREVVGPQVHLDSAASVLDVPEDDLPLRAPGLDPAGDGDLRALIAHFVPVQLERGRGAVGRLEAIGERTDPERLQRRPLLPPMPLRLAQLLAHAACSPNRFR